MTEQILEKEDVVFDSPYLRRLRKQAEEEAQATVQATVQKELKEWMQKGVRKDVRKDTFLRYARQPWMHSFFSDLNRLSGTIRLLFNNTLRQGVWLH